MLFCKIFLQYDKISSLGNIFLYKSYILLQKRRYLWFLTHLLLMCHTNTHYEKIFDFNDLCNNLYQYGYAYVKNILNNLNNNVSQGLFDTLKNIQTHNNLTSAHIGQRHNRILEHQTRADKIH